MRKDFWFPSREAVVYAEKMLATEMFESVPGHRIPHTASIGITYGMTAQEISICKLGRIQATAID